MNLLSFLLSGVVIAFAAPFLILCRMLTVGLLPLLKVRKLFTTVGVVFTCCKCCALVLSFCSKLLSHPKHCCAALLPPPVQQQDQEQVQKKCLLRTAAGESSISRMQKWVWRSELGERKRTQKREGEGVGHEGEMVQFKGVMPENINRLRQVSVARQISAHLT